MKETDNSDSSLSRIEKAILRLEQVVLDSERRESRRYRLVLLEAAEALRQTKNAFHSKQLRDLRERIETALER